MKTIRITHSTGLHARPCGMITKEAQQYASAVSLVREGKEYNAKSIMALMSMGVSCGETIGILATGADAESAELALHCLIEKINQE